MCITTATHNCEALDPTTHTHTRTKTHTYTQRQGILARRGADAFQAAIARHALGAPLRRQRPCPRLRTVRRVRTRGVPCSDRTRGAGLCPTRQLSLCILHIALRARTHIVIYGSAHAIAWVLCCARHMQKLPACVPPPLPVCMPRTAARGDAKGASHRGRLRVPAGFAHGGAASLLAGPCPSSASKWFVRRVREAISEDRSAMAVGGDGTLMQSLTWPWDVRQAGVREGVCRGPRPARTLAECVPAPPPPRRRAQRQRGGAGQQLRCGRPVRRTRSSLEACGVGAARAGTRSLPVYLASVTSLQACLACIYMYVCMCVCAYVCMYVRVCVRMYVCMHACMYVCMYVSM